MMYESCTTYEMSLSIIACNNFLRGNLILNFCLEGQIIVIGYYFY